MTYVDDVRVVLGQVVCALFGMLLAGAGTQTFRSHRNSYEFVRVVSLEEALGRCGRLEEFGLLVRVTSPRVVPEGLLAERVLVTLDAQVRRRLLVFINYRPGEIRLTEGFRNLTGAL